MNKEKRSLLKNDGVQSFIASIICILLGLLLGYVVLLFINPAGAGDNEPCKELFQLSEHDDSAQILRQHACKDRAAADVLAVDPVCV